MGDRKPSELFRDIFLAAGGSSVVSPELIPNLWQRLLLKSISIAITSSGKFEEKEILDIANKVWEACMHDISIASVSAIKTITTSNNFSPVSENSSSHIAQLCSDFKEL